MPITPFHFGPGALIAVASRRTVSLLAFVATNVLIDVESLYNMVTGQPRIHTFFHTYVGSTLAAALILLMFLPCRWVARRLPPWPMLGWRQLGIPAVVLGSLAGAWSHVLLDSVMHRDITPLAPFSNANSLYQAVTLQILHWGCVIAGVVGTAWYWLRDKPPKDGA